MSTNVKTATKTPTASAARPEWGKARRIVVKIGSALLTDRATGALKSEWLASLIDDVAARRAGKRSCWVLGAIARPPC
jgi:glutamate 5-kinase